MVSHAHRLAFSRAHAVEWVGHGVWARPVYAGAHGLATKHQERLDGVVLCRLEEAFHILSRARAGKRVRRKRRASQHCTIHTLLSTASVPQFKRGSTPEEAAQEREHTKGGNSRERAHQRRQFRRGRTPEVHCICMRARWRRPRHGKAAEGLRSRWHRLRMGRPLRTQSPAGQS